MARISLVALAVTACTTTPQPRVTLPADDGRHEAPVEWWYWTGHLTTEGGHHFGFQITFFVINDVIVDHAALSDIESSTFHSVHGAGAVPPSAASLALAGGHAHASGGGGTWQLAAQLKDASFELATDLGPIVLHHRRGHRTFDGGGESFYYSRPRLPVRGEVELHGTTFAVTGEAWFDHQWGELQPIIDAGWDWLGIQLDDGRSLMVLVVRSAGAPIVDGTWLTDGTTARLDPATVHLHATGEWQSPHSRCTYPSGWQLRVGDLDLMVTPAFAGQEQVLADPSASYWEGAARVSGDATGRAYVELTGYCR